MGTEENARKMVERAFLENSAQGALRQIMAQPSFQELSRKVTDAIGGHDAREILTLVAALLTSMTPYDRDHAQAAPIVSRAVQVTDTLVRDDGMRAPELLLFMAAILSGLAINTPPRA
jgi:hypothetical protein